MAQKQNLNEAMRQLDQALSALEDVPAPPTEEPPAPPVAAPITPPATPAPEARMAPPEARTPTPETRTATSECRHTSTSGPAPSEALVRLAVGAALLGLDGLKARASDWESQAGIAPQRPAPPRVDTATQDQFRHALVGWLFEAERELRPRGSPIRWLRAVVYYLFGTIFSVLLELLPLPRPRTRRGDVPPEPSDEDTQRWVAVGMAEAEPSRRYAQVALEEIVDRSIIYLARRPAVQQALGELVRSPAMDAAVAHIVDGPVIEQATLRVAASPALDTVIAKVGASPALEATVAQIGQSPVIEDTVRHVVQSPAMQDAVRHLVDSPAMSDAIDTLAQSPSLVALVTTQGTTVLSEFLREVRERGVSADKLAEGVVRRILRRPPRTDLPLETISLLIIDAERPDTVTSRQL